MEPEDHLRSYLNRKYEENGLDCGMDLLRDLKLVPKELQTSRIRELIIDLETLRIQGSRA